MIKAAIALSKAEMTRRKEEMLNRKDVVVISIIDPGAEHVFCETHHSLKLTSFEFHDVEPVSSCILSYTYIPMSIEQARTIFGMIRSYANRDEEYYLFVNCTAGICRSGAVVEFARRYCVLNNDEFLQMNPQIIPNMWVLNLLCYFWNIEQNK